MKKNPINHTADASAITLNFFALILVITAFLLLIPAFSGLPVFSNGEFTYIESLGFILIFLAFLLAGLAFIINKITLLKTQNETVKKVIYTLAVIGGVFIALSASGLIWMRYDVKSHCQYAVKTYAGDCVGALTELLKDDNQDYYMKNKSVYTLGQLADNRALPVLKKFYTGKIPQRESLYKTLSQYELKKAIKWCVEGNITSWMYWDHNNWR